MTDFLQALDIASIVAITDNKGIITYANDTFCNISGYSIDELIGQTHRIINSGFHSKSFFKDMWETISRGNVWKGEIKNRAKNGSDYWVNTTIIPFVDTNGVTEEYISIRIDITKLKQTEASLQTALKNGFQTTIKNLENCIFKYTKNSKGQPVFTLSEGKVAERVGIVTEAIYNKEVKDIFPENVVDHIYKNFVEAYKGKPMDFEVHVVNIDFLVYLSPIIQDNKVIEVVGTAIDITERKKSEQLINHMAYHDTLTGLHNRAFFYEKITKMIQIAKQNKETFAVMFLDLDQFKNINDTLGHAMGDLLLIDVSNRLVDCVYKDQSICRLGGDEYVILLPNCNEEQAAIIAERIIDQISAPFLIKNHEIYITPSIGVSMFPKDGEELLKNADAAMYQAKLLGRSNFQFFTQDLAYKLNKKVALENDLRKALQREEWKIICPECKGSGREIGYGPAYTSIGSCRICDGHKFLYYPYY